MCFWMGFGRVMLHEGNYLLQGRIGIDPTLDQNLAHLRRSNPSAVAQQLLYLREEAVVL